MQRRTKQQKNKKPEPAVYDLNTPSGSKYYQKVRKSIRFPRYYKKALNW